MPKHGLSPVMSMWRKVLSTCCKNEKSRKATAILLDWVSRSFGMHVGGRMENDLPCRAFFVLVTNVFPLCETKVEVMDNVNCALYRFTVKLKLRAQFAHRCEIMDNDCQHSMDRH